MPIGRGRTFASNIGPALDAVIGGWDIAGITTAQSGESETSTVSSDLAIPEASAIATTRLHNPKDFTYDTTDQAALGCTPGQRNILCWYNPAAFTAPPLASGQQSAHAFGDARIGNLRGPNLVDFDFVLQKNFRIADHGQIEFRSEFFNIFNHPNLGLPGTYVDVPGGAAITNTAADNRELEFAFKYSF